MGKQDPSRRAFWRLDVSLLKGLPVATGLLAGCGGEAPRSCDAMCAVAAERESACLGDAGLTWEDAGYADEGAYADACVTWAWEQVRLQGRTATIASCDERSSAIPEADCEEFWSIDWN